MRLPVHIWIREENSGAAEVAGYIVELARRLDERPERMKLVVESSVPVSIDFDPSDGHPVVETPQGRARAEIRRRWIPEHDVPLAVGPSVRPDGHARSGRNGRIVLLVDPVDGNRFRVRRRIRPDASKWLYPLFACSATLAVVTLDPFAIASTVAVLLLFACLRMWYN